MSVITLLTDFGRQDSFTAQMKGVILTINSACRIIDITHEIDSFNIKKAAITLGFCYKYFPTGTINVAVVDPGVGSNRRGIVAAAGGYYFVGPDNGIFSYIYQDCKDEVSVYHLTNNEIFLSNDSSTFHGRDVFAPVAAHLSKGFPIDKLGIKINDYIKINIPKPQINKEIIKGEILYIDHFGNAITNIEGKYIPKKATVTFNGMDIKIINYYGQADSDTPYAPYALINSSGLLELFIKNGHFAQEYLITEGQPVEIAKEFIPYHVQL
ncbi:MAG: SAM-dependent chlorinase/fluorinase [Nitrospirae bacterium]|nr:SAM-dependent chlorinase/fluorinase [Nitrospirota bacterium]